MSNHCPAAFLQDQLDAYRFINSGYRPGKRSETQQTPSFSQPAQRPPSPPTQLEVQQSSQQHQQRMQPPATADITAQLIRYGAASKTLKTYI